MTDGREQTGVGGYDGAAGRGPTPENSHTGIGPDGTTPGDDAVTVCSAPTRSGTPCRVAIDLCPTHGTCAAHDPCRAAAFRERQRNATAAAAEKSQLRATSRRARAAGAALDRWPLDHPGAPRDVAEVTTLITEAVAAVARGTLRPDVGRAITAMCETALRGYKTADLARQLAEQRERLAALERGR